MYTRRKLATRASVVGSIAAAAIVAAASTATAATPVPLSPLFTVGHGSSVSGPAICGGVIDATAHPGDSSIYGTNSVTLTTHFVGITSVCTVDGTLKWHNLDTGASGSKDWWLVGYDGPHAPTSVYFTPGAGRVSIEITATTPNIPGRGEIVAP